MKGTQSRVKGNSFHEEKLKRTCFFCKKCQSVPLENFGHKTIDHMKHFAALRLDEALAQVRKKCSPQFLCISCHFLLSRATRMKNVSFGNDDAAGSTAFRVAPIIKFETWEPHDPVDCRVCSAVELDDVEPSTETSTLGKSLIGESTMNSAANRILVLILKLYDSFDALDEDPVDAAFAFLLAVISEAQAQIRHSLAEAWEKYVRSAKAAPKTRPLDERPSNKKGKPELRRSDSPAWNFGISSPTNDHRVTSNAIAVPYVADLGTTLKESEERGIQQFPAYYSAVVKSEVIQENVAEIEGRVGDYEDALRLAINRYERTISDNVQPQFAGLFSRVPVIVLDRAEAAPNASRCAESSVSAARDASLGAIVLYPDSTGVAEAAKRKWKKRMERSKEKNPPQKSVDSSLPSPNILPSSHFPPRKICPVCQYVFKHNFVREILAHKRFCGDWDKIAEELKQPNRKQNEREKEPTKMSGWRPKGLHSKPVKKRMKKMKKKEDLNLTEEELREEEESEWFEDAFRGNRNYVDVVGRGEEEEREEESPESDLGDDVEDDSCWDEEDSGDDDDRGGKSFETKSSISCPTCNKSFSDGRGNLRAAVARRVADGDMDFIQSHVDRCSFRRARGLLIACQLCDVSFVSNRPARLRHFRKYHPETILICPVNGCGTRLVDGTSDFQRHLRLWHGDGARPLYVSDGNDVFHQNSLKIEGWCDEGVTVSGRADVG